MSPPLILVADDQAELRDILTRMLSRWGYHVITAEDGADAVRMARLHSPDLILMDLRMPRMDGYQATRHLKAHESTCEIPVVAVTASVLWETAEELHRLGFAGYAMKPVQPDDLRAFVELGLLSPPFQA